MLSNNLALRCCVTALWRQHWNESQQFHCYGVNNEKIIRDIYHWKIDEAPESEKVANAFRKVVVVSAKAGRMRMVTFAIDQSVVWKINREKVIDSALPTRWSGLKMSSSLFELERLPLHMNARRSCAGRAIILIKYHIHLNHMASEMTTVIKAS